MFKAFNSKKEDGFTLIELLITIVILGIIMGIAIPVFLNQSDKAKAAAAKTSVSLVADAIKTGIGDGSLSGVTPVNGSTATSGANVVNTAGNTPVAGTTIWVNSSTGAFCVSKADGGKTYVETDLAALAEGTVCLAA